MGTLVSLLKVYVSYVTWPTPQLYLPSEAGGGHCGRRGVCVADCPAMATWKGPLVMGDRYPLWGGWSCPVFILCSGVPLHPLLDCVVFSLASLIPRFNGQGVWDWQHGTLLPRDWWPVQGTLLHSYGENGGKTSIFVVPEGGWDGIFKLPAKRGCHWESDMLAKTWWLHRSGMVPFYCFPFCGEEKTNYLNDSSWTQVGVIPKGNQDAVSTSVSREWNR